MRLKQGERSDTALGSFVLTSEVTLDFNVCQGFV